MDKQAIQLTECPRDAMQGIKMFIPTEVKVEYLNLLLACGFKRLDFGSFVSPKAIPQLSDTAEVLTHLSTSNTELLAIVANERGVERALEFERISFLGYPFSISEQFQIRNTNATIKESFNRIKGISRDVHDSNRKVMLYLSMGFGNPYGDPWSVDLVVDYAKSLYETLGIKHFALSDTIGCATPEQLELVFNAVKNALPNLEIGVHLHAAPNKAVQLIDAGIRAGCESFDSALLGIGGCPMAKDELTGNLATETLLEFSVNAGIDTGIVLKAFKEARKYAATLFNQYH